MRSCSRSLAGVCATVRFGLAGAAILLGAAVSNRPTLPHADSVKAAHSTAGAAKRRRPALPSRRPERSVTSATLLLNELISASERANSHPALQSAPPGASQFVAHPAPRQSRGHESVDFRGT